ncbi:MAG: hypothetical protein AAFP10_02735 [Pseudomonadota bacterium]
MSDLNSVRKLIESEIYKYIPYIGASNEKVDKVLKGKVTALIEALECINESDTVEDYGKKIRSMYRIRQGATDSLRKIMNELGVKYR